MASVGWQQEGKVTFQVGSAFYRQHSRISRDLAVLAAAVYRHQTGQLRVLDAMTGCGVRPLRYALEAKADWVWANEGNPELRSLLEQNLSDQLDPHQFRITHQDANSVFFDCHLRQDYYDLVDIDSFGCAAPYISTGLWAVKLDGLLYLTDTDGRTSSGHNRTRGLAAYGAYPRSHPAVYEQGLRLLLGSVWQQAAAKGFGIQPIFSLFAGHIHRVMVRVLPKVNDAPSSYGFLGYCHSCGHFQTVCWQQLGRASCPHHADPQPLTLSGPLWLGPLHDRQILEPMAQLAQQWNWTEAQSLLEIMQAEAEMPPYYFALAEIGRRGKQDIPARDRLIQALQAQGYRASLTHLDPQAIKTDASFATCLAIAAQI